MSKNLKHVIIYTDGGCDPNPGPGGYGIVLIYPNARKTLSGGFRHTTNNRMEMYAAIHALESLKEPCQVTLYSDSAYLVNAIQKGWAKQWQANGWKRQNDEPAINADLWERLLAQCQIHQVEFKKVHGHAGNTENELCDRLARRARSQPNLPPDEGFESKPEATSTKMTMEGQPCRKCGAPVVKKKPKKAPKPSQAYYFEYYLYCPQCKTMYLVESAKRQRSKQ